MHRSCALRYFHRLSNSASNSTTRKTNYPCPVCKTEWNQDDVANILKEISGHDDNDTQQTIETANKRQRTSRTSDHNNSTSNRSVRSTQRRRIQESDEDDDD